MKWSSTCLLLLLAFVCANVKAQSEDELAIPIESDNQFPPDNHSENDGAVIEGSGEGVVENPSIHTTTELNATPKLEEVEAPVVLHNEVITSTDKGIACPSQCVCNTEGDTNEFVVNCAGLGLTEFPSSIDPKTTKLNLQKNKLTEIPKQVSALKNLKELNANDNSIMEIASGSVSELPELVILKLANNRIIEYPKDLKNSLLLTKLQELDLGGNDMRTALSPEIFSGFSNLRKITLAAATPELVQNLCLQLKDTLQLVCTGSCDKESLDCPDGPHEIDDDLLEATLPGMIVSETITDGNKENADPTIGSPIDLNSGKEEPDKISPITTNVESTTVTTSKGTPENKLTLHAAVLNAPVDVIPSNAVTNTPKEEPTNKEGDVKIGAKTADTKSGGIDRSTIAIIVAGMVVVVAVVIIKKNWSSIKKRFSSTPRSPNERAEGNANGTSPEEIPLQDKSPV